MKSFFKQDILKCKDLWQKYIFFEKRLILFKSCDYQGYETLKECTKWVMDYKYELEQDNARFIQITINNGEEIVFYDNVIWENGKSNLNEIAKSILEINKI
ncbi:MAG: hypothetical protein J6O88_15120 [Chryseobacterium sp.]|uniref:hypothetical protein n=1 Tax=Chryseobacterium sp. TaxID=1871047 RepID=UPI001B00A285|nr:hypothetical protein [Chryseobacterium sp.]MBO6185989.1 hypothetical protein [Chryseobacterium sp.]